MVDLIFGKLRTKSQTLSANYLRFPDRIIRVISKEMMFSNASLPPRNGRNEERKTNMAATLQRTQNVSALKREEDQITGREDISTFS